VYRLFFILSSSSGPYLAPIIGELSLPLDYSEGGSSDPIESDVSVGLPLSWFFSMKGNTVSERWFELFSRDYLHRLAVNLFPGLQRDPCDHAGHPAIGQSTSPSALLPFCMPKTKDLPFRVSAAPD
jgi:hypothetical protein